MTFRSSPLITALVLLACGGAEDPNESLDESGGATTVAGTGGGTSAAGGRAAQAGGGAGTGAGTANTGGTANLNGSAGANVGGSNAGDTGGGGLVGMGGRSAMAGRGSGAAGEGASGTSTGGVGATSGSASGGGGAGGTPSGGGMSNGGGSGGNEPGDCTPINPNASEQVKNVLCYLYSIYGESTLSGQQETSWNPNPADDVNWINQQTGKFPAVLGGDYLYPDGTTSRAKAYWDAGGLTMIRYHMGAPPLSDTYENSKGTADINAVLMEGSSANTSFKSKLDYVAEELATLQAGNVPVLWAPFHEVQPNGWFWWSKGTGPQFVSLWEYMYDYLTNTKGLNNLIWLLPFSGTPDAAYYPGKEFVDLAGPDTYDKGQPFAPLYAKTTSIVGSSIPIPLHETGVIPDPDQMFPSAAPWLLFSVWAGYQSDTSQNSVAMIKATYANARTITRDEVPDLK